MNNSASNYEIAVLAVFLLGGQSQTIDTEDIAIKADELAPGRFRWRKYQDQVNLDAVRIALSDAKKPKNGAYVLGTAREGWMLSTAGVEFARRRITELGDADLSRTPLSPKERQWIRVETTRLIATEAFLKFRDGRLTSVTRQEAEAFFRVDDYVLGTARQRKITRIVNAFGDDPELGEAVRALAAMLEEGG